MYEIYLIKHTDTSSEIFRKKTTKGFHAASKIFWRYRQEPHNESDRIELLVDLDNENQVRHRFGSLNGEQFFVGLNDKLPGKLLSRTEIDPNWHSHRKNKKRIEACLVGDEIELYERAMEKYRNGPKYGLRQLLVELLMKDDSVD